MTNSSVALPPRALPLQIVMGALFCLLVAGVGLAIGLFGFRESRTMLLSASQEVFSHADRQMQLSALNLFQPLQAAIEQLAYHPATGHSDWQQRLPAAAALADILDRNASVASVYIGYLNGDFMMLRPLRNTAERQRWQAPDAASYSLEQIDRQAPQIRYQRLYFDRQRQRIGQRNVSDAPLDPRLRPWFKLAHGSDGVAMTQPYIFFSTRDPGITLTRRAASGSVVAADLTLRQLSDDLAAIHISPSACKVLLDDGGGTIAGMRMQPTTVGATPPGKLANQHDPLISELLRDYRQHSTIVDTRINGIDWLGHASRLSVGGHIMWLVLAAPRDELLQDATRLRDMQLWLTLLILCASMPLAWQASRWVSKPLALLAEEVRAIEAFDFSRPITHRSFIREVDQLAQTMSGMKTTIARFLELTAALSSERQLEQLLQKVMDETANVLNPNDCAIYLREDDGSLLKAADRSGGVELPQQLHAGAGSDAELAQLCHQAVAQQQQQEIDSADYEQRISAIPLCTPQGGAVGVMVLLFSHAVQPSAAAMAFATSLSGTAAISIDAQRLLEAQKRLLEAVIRLIADAIDAKSPYTGAHCQRVPVLTEMLADAACNADSGPFRDFRLDAEQREALRMAAWLHDCGKVTTPEFVVDKATKLETLYDRIHEIRTRFEVLKRDAQIEYWRAVATGGLQAGLAEQLQQTLTTLDEEFAFVAGCNLGGESMREEDQVRLQAIGSRTWQRTLDDRIGIAHEELQRKRQTPAETLPATEYLLADRPEHLIARQEHERIAADNPWGFKLDTPRHKYNRGELYNLGIARGTLNAEERYQINDHIVQSIMMLSQLPFPPHLRNVPELAGGHHEKMDGSGYPKRLRREQMSVPARMMAIADIFEALTAIDRPYKPGKTLSQALEIMARMRDERHIDAELFELFLHSGIPVSYGQRYLQPEQLDQVDIGRYSRPT
ncbi:MAG: HD domain-containing phosphohydrolase [Chitinivorax sp.]